MIVANNDNDDMFHFEPAPTITCSNKERNNNILRTIGTVWGVKKIIRIFWEVLERTISGLISSYYNYCIISWV